MQMWQTHHMGLFKYDTWCWFAPYIRQFGGLKTPPFMSTNNHIPTTSKSLTKTDTIFVWGWKLEHRRYLYNLYEWISDNYFELVIIRDIHNIEC